MSEYIDYVVVLNDGETFTSIDGCRILRIPDTVDPIGGDWDYAIKSAYMRGAGVDICELWDAYGEPAEEALMGPEYLELWDNPL